MQIDFHHSVIYVLSRLAGFDAKESNIIAYSSQHVDDSVSSDAITFKNGAIYKPISSVHKTLDYRNFDNLSNHFVWIAFHFLPGNDMLPVGKGQELDKHNFISRVICRPDSYVARDMVSECIRRHNEPNSLYRLGITMHVYADTWAHQGFAGIQHHVNKVGYLGEDEVSKNLITKVSRYFAHIFDEKISKIVDDVLPLGHGAVLSYPDLPYLKWSYEDHNGKEIRRDNSLVFINAVKKIFIAMKRFRLGDPDAEVECLDNRSIDKIAELFEEIDDEDGCVRHQKWLQKIKEGVFRFGSENVTYVDSGPGSWEHAAFGESGCRCSASPEFRPEFMECDWKKFYDTLRDHHHFLYRNLFPRYKICIA